MGRNEFALLHGTLDFLILKALADESRHGYGIVRWIERASADALAVEEGSLYPALRRLEEAGLVSGRWGTSENNRRARYYRLTSAGRRRLAEEHERWRRFAEAMNRVAEAEPRHA
jgi:transcriptional regulator